MVRIAVLGLAILFAGTFLFIQGEPFPLALGILLGLLTLLWALSLILKDASIIDIFWGPGFVVMAWYGFAVSGGKGDLHGLILCSLVTIWGLRLGLHIFLRNRGKGEDFRYQEWREAGGKHYWWISYFRVFVLQGLLLWIISSPLLVAQQQGAFSGWDFLGVTLWITGFLFEAVGDWQLARFKADPANKGRVLDRGLWRYTRHPNYFGDALLWWGYFCFALSAPGGWAYLFSPLLMTYLLRQVSGVTLLEESLVSAKPQYREYIRKTPAFFPWFPKP